MKKKLGIVAAVLLGLVVIVVAVVWLNLNGIVRSTVQSQATTSLNVSTTLGGAKLSLFGGSVNLSDLRIGSPKGFSAPEMFTLGDVDLKTSLGGLRGRPIRVSEITIERPTLVIEQAGGTFNFKALIDNLPAGDPTPADSSEPIKLIIDKLTVSGTRVLVRPGLKLPGVPEEIPITIPSVEMSQIGNGEGNHNGAAIKEIVSKVMTTLVAKASESEQLPPQVRELMKLNIHEVAAKLEAEFKQSVTAVTEGVSNAATQALSDPSKLKDAGKNLENVGKGLGDGLKGAFGQDKKDKSDPKKK